MYKKIEEMYLNDEEFTDEIVYTLTENTYRQELLAFFQLNEFDEKKINESVNTLYEKLKENQDLQNILEILKTKFDEEVVFHMLFSYDYFHLFLPIIDKLLNNVSIEEEIKQF
jgi:hypothetical protein